MKYQRRGYAADLPHQEWWEHLYELFWLVVLAPVFIVGSFFGIFPIDNRGANDVSTGRKLGLGAMLFAVLISALVLANETHKRLDHRARAIEKGGV
jgi:hypothetical protein